jgi:signal transduction histidine kinase
MKRHWLFTWRGITKSAGVRFALVVFLLQALVTTIIVIYVERTMWTQFELEQKAPVIRLRDSMLAEYRVGGLGGLTKLINERITKPYSDDVALMLISNDDQVVAGNLTEWPSGVSVGTVWTTRMIRTKGAERQKYMGFVGTQLRENMHILTGAVVESEDRLTAMHRDALRVSALISFPAALLIAFIAAWMIDRQLQEIIRIAVSLGRGKFQERVKLNGSGDGFDAIKELVNRTLDMLEPLVGELQLVGNGLAHDLRSPITRLRVTLERAMTQTNDPGALSAMNKVMVETDSLLSMLAMTLQISNAEAGASRDRFKAIEVTVMLQDLAEIYGPLAEDKGFTITVDAPAGMTKLLHRDLVGQALSNLIENALNYADGGSKIVLSAARNGVELSIIVADNGVGIPAHRYDDAKRRYGRLDPARQLPGSGLGLSLVESVARMHGGRIVLSDNAPGLIVTMAFPAKKP